MNPYKDNDPTELSEDGILYKKALEAWGLNLQIEMITEELGELIVAIQKWKRNPSETTVINIANEVADVEIMLGQLQYIMDSSVERKYGVHLDEARREKRGRLRARMHCDMLEKTFGSHAWVD